MTNSLFYTTNKHPGNMEIEEDLKKKYSSQTLAALNASYPTVPNRTSVWMQDLNNLESAVLQNSQQPEKLNSCFIANSQCDSVISKSFKIYKSIQYSEDVASLNLQSMVDSCQNLQRITTQLELVNNIFEHVKSSATSSTISISGDNSNPKQPLEPLS